MMRWFSVGILLTSLLCYLEWGTDKHYFIFQMEYLFFFSTENISESFKHPLILLPFIGQLLLIISVFQKKPSAKIILTGLLMLSALVFMIALAGALSINLKMVSSTLPFIVIGVFFVIRFFKKDNIKQ